MVSPFFNVCAQATDRILQHSSNSNDGPVQNSKDVMPVLHLSNQHALGLQSCIAAAELRKTISLPVALALDT